MTQLQRHILHLLFLIPFIGVGQDPHFSQFYAVPTTLGPSFAGSTNGGRLATVARDQWPMIEGEFITAAAAVDYNFLNARSGLGLTLMRDQAGNGALALTNAMVQYAYSIRLFKKFYVRPGLQFSYSHRSVDYSKVLFGDQLSWYGPKEESVETLISQKRQYIDFSYSTLGFYKTTWLGFTVDHLNTPNQTLASGESKVPLKYSVYGGYRHEFYTRFKTRTMHYAYAAFLFRKQAKFSQMDVGVYWEKDPVFVGLWYRGIPFVKTYQNYLNNDAIITVVGMKWQQYRLGYSFDFTTSGLISDTGGAHEVSFFYLFNQDQKARRKEAIVPCPRF